jgi:AAHS family 4-hydroxybenzoate transporter-like MFS transporter
MASRSRVDVSAIIDNSRLGPFQISIFVLCFLCLAIDGYDVQSLGYVVPALSADLGVARVDLGRVISAAPFGVLFGSIACSILADRIGRRPVLIGATVFFAIMTLLTARASTQTELLVVRAIGGIGMGAIMPNAVALVGEYSPKAHRVTIMMIVATGFTVGAALGGFVAAWLLPVFGWRSIFYFGAVVPLVIAFFMLLALPESIQFLAVKKRQLAKLKKWLHRVDSTVPMGNDVEYWAGPNAAAPAAETAGSWRRVPFIALFSDGLGPGTALLWIINFMNLLNIYFLQGWLTLVITDLGVPEASAALVASMVQVGGVVGAFTLGWVVYRIGFVPVLTLCGLLGALNIALIGQPWVTTAGLFVVVFVAGLCVIGGQSAINALSAVFYPTSQRATGVGAGLGVGRVGAIIGPSLASVFIGYGWSLPDIFLAAAVPPLVLVACMLAWRALIGPAAASTHPEPVRH